MEQHCSGRLSKSCFGHNDAPIEKIEQEDPIKIFVYPGITISFSAVTHEDCPIPVQSQSLARGSPAAIKGGLC